MFSTDLCICEPGADPVVQCMQVWVELLRLIWLPVRNKGRMLGLQAEMAESRASDIVAHVNIWSESGHGNQLMTLRRKLTYILKANP